MAGQGDSLAVGAARTVRALGDDARVTMEDVAALAGVSIGTVSNTINRPEIVRSNTREAVERAIRELGFVPNQQARMLVGVSSQVLGLVVMDIASPLFMAVARAVERAAAEAGHVLILGNSDGSPEREGAMLDVLAAERVRGVLLSPSASDNLDRQSLAARRLPVVFLDFASSPDDCSVAVDNMHGSGLAVRHLLDLGHERLAFVGGPAGLQQMAQRVRGARETIVEAGLDPSVSLVELALPGIGIQEGMMAAERLLENGLPTGIFCGNDMMAFGVYRGLARAGVRIPEDIALVGYDDIDFAADWVVPLTSVRQPIDELGQQATRLLLEHTSGDESHVHRQVILQPELIVRNSSDPRSR